MQENKIHKNKVHVFVNDIHQLSSHLNTKVMYFYDMSSLQELPVNHFSKAIMECLMAVLEIMPLNNMFYCRGKCFHKYMLFGNNLQNDKGYSKENIPFHVKELIYKRFQIYEIEYLYLISFFTEKQHQFAVKIHTT